MNKNCARDMLRSDAAKWLRFHRCLESNEDSINAQAEGKTKFLFLILLPYSVVSIAKIAKPAEIFKETEA
jgi:hypothetical protein